MNSNGGSPTPAGVIPGWRVILSDAGRLWASRQVPFPRETDRCAPPYRTVDADTLDELRAEVERQEQAARNLEAAEQTGQSPTDQETTPSGKTASGTASGQAGR
ncbi:hypothetical protein GCM10017673_23030 [Streptosporangium violaceochromogenes]|nr:hypothetical protein GCM10017673_23030 [Streptosporangium violaceochromogenes]